MQIGVTIYEFIMYDSIACCLFGLSTKNNYTITMPNCMIRLHKYYLMEYLSFIVGCVIVTFSSTSDRGCFSCDTVSCCVNSYFYLCLTCHSHSIGSYWISTQRLASLSLFESVHIYSACCTDVFTFWRLSCFYFSDWIAN